MMSFKRFLRNLLFSLTFRETLARIITDGTKGDISEIHWTDRISSIMCHDVPMARLRNTQTNDKQ